MKSHRIFHQEFIFQFLNAHPVKIPITFIHLKLDRNLFNWMETSNFKAPQR